MSVQEQRYSEEGGHKASRHPVRHRRLTGNSSFVMWVLSAPAYWGGAVVWAACASFFASSGLGCSALGASVLAEVGLSGLP